jgi:hypothetical protein
VGAVMRMYTDYDHTPQFAIFTDHGEIGMDFDDLQLSACIAITDYGIMIVESQNWNNFVMVF